MSSKSASAALLSVAVLAGICFADSGDPTIDVRPSVLLVRVSDGMGHPLFGADVALIETEYATFGAGGYLDARGVTDEEGVVRLRGLRSCSSRYLLSVSHPDFAALHESDVYIPFGEKTVEVILNSGSSIAGIVLDVSSRPVPGAVVKLRRPGRSPALFALTRGDGFNWSKAPETISDSDGRFVLSRVGPGVHGVLASVQNAIGWRAGVRSGSDGIEVRLRPGRSLVLGGADAGLPHSRGLLRARDAPLQYPLTMGDGGDIRVVSVPPGVYDLVLGDPLPLLRDTIVVSSGTQETLFHRLPAVPALGQAALLSGVVIDEEGRPVEGASVVAACETDEGLRACSPVCRSSRDGRFLIDRIPEGIRRVRILAEKGETWGGEDLMLPLEGSPRITLGQPCVRFGIRVTDEAGMPVQGCRITLGRTALLPALPQPAVHTEADGETTWFARVLPSWAFSAASESPGRNGEADQVRRVEIDVDASPAFLKVSRTVEAADGKVIDLRLRRAPCRTGVILDGSGRPASGLRILSGTAHADSDSQGRFCLFGVRPDENLSELRWTVLPPGLTSPEVFPRLSSDLRIPEARRWPLEVLGLSSQEGYAIRIDAAEARHCTGCPQAFMDQDGLACPGAFLPGDYTVTVFSGVGGPSESGIEIRQRLVLPPSPTNGVWRVRLGEK